MIEVLFPDSVATVVAGPAMWSMPLHPEEAAALDGAGERRCREFAAGRACARTALAQLGLPPAPIGRGSDRAPRWPLGVVGSISHCRDYCAAAVALRCAFGGIGLDVERSGRVHAALLARVTSPAEREQLAGLEAGGADWATVLFSAKESTHKCYYPLTGVTLGFRDVEVRIEPETSSFTVYLRREDAPAAGGARRFSGRFACQGARVATGIALAPGGDAS
jgi:4'-phosphopantetheinyl transferase EntD